MFPFVLFSALFSSIFTEPEEKRWVCNSSDATVWYDYCGEYKGKTRSTIPRVFSQEPSSAITRTQKTTVFSSSWGGSWQQKGCLVPALCGFSPSITDFMSLWTVFLLTSKHSVLSCCQLSLPWTQFQILHCSGRTICFWDFCLSPRLTRGFPGGSDGKESVCNAGYLGSNSGLGRSPGEGNGYPLQYSCLENSMDGGVWQAIVHEIAKSQTIEWLTEDWLVLLEKVEQSQLLLGIGSISRLWFFFPSSTVLGV